MGREVSYPSIPLPAWPLEAAGMRMERETGFEPATCSLEGCRSAN